MSKYTTGEMAKLCNVSVRTVQFYDTKNLLNPTELTEGGRRLYSDADLKKFQLICLLKSFGLTLDSIRGVLESETPGKILLLLLDVQEKELGGEIMERERQLKTIKLIRENILNSNTIPVDTIIGIEKIMKNKKKLRKVHVIMLAVGLVMSAIEICTILVWIFKGIWIPFAVGMPIVIILGILIFNMYIKNVAYICPECNIVFQPPGREFFSFKHTPKTRKLRCPSCGHIGYCVECAHEA